MNAHITRHPGNRWMHVPQAVGQSRVLRGDLCSTVVIFQLLKMMMIVRHIRSLYLFYVPKYSFKSEIIVSIKIPFNEYIRLQRDQKCLHVACRKT